MLTYADVCRMLTYADVCHMQLACAQPALVANYMLLLCALCAGHTTDVCCRMLTYADLLLTYADVC